MASLGLGGLGMPIWLDINPSSAHEKVDAFSQSDARQ